MRVSFVKAFKPKTASVKEGEVMDATVRQHLSTLEAQVRLFSEQMVDRNRTAQERELLAGALRSATLAIAHYEAALRMERKLSSRLLTEVGDSLVFSTENVHNSASKI